MWGICTSHFGPKKIDRVGRGGQGRFKYCPKWASFLASRPSLGPEMGQGPLKWTQINQGQLGEHIENLGYLFRPLAPDFKIYIFGILAQFVTIWHQQKRWVFFFEYGPLQDPCVTVICASGIPALKLLCKS